MRITRKSGLIAVGALAACATIAWAAGNWSTLPQVGMSSFCASNVSGVALPTAQGPYGVVPGSTQGTGSGICGQTVPAGPTALTGSELIPADTQAANSAPPQTVTIPMPLVASGAYNYVAVPTYGAIQGYTIPNNITTELLDPTQTVAGVTITLPVNPLNGQIVNLASSHTITALSVITPTVAAGGASGTLIANAPTALTVSATGPFNYSFIYDSVQNEWYRTQ